MPGESASHSLASRVAWIGLVLGPVLALVVYLMLPQLPPADAATAGDAVAQGVGGASRVALSPEGRAVAAVAVLMAVWWITEALDISVTALVPVVAFPLLGVLKLDEAASRYADPLLFLFAGGFVLGLAMERWGLHKRIALWTVSLVGAGPARLIGGFMLASWLMSMWVSNTATTLMMLPIASSVIALFASVRATPPEGSPAHPAIVGPGLDRGAQHRDANFAPCAMLSIAYASSIGGIATLVGTPPNAVFAAQARELLGVTIEMGRWASVFMPVSAVCLVIAWLIMTRWAYPLQRDAMPGARDLIRRQRKALGRASRGEWSVFIVFIITALAWVFRPVIASWATKHGIPLLPQLSDPVIAMLAALALFIIPVSLKERTFAMDWHVAERMPWGVLILFGGGLCLARAITATGVDDAIGQLFAGLGTLPPFLVVVLVVLLVVGLTEVTSNTAVATAVLPVLFAAGEAMGVDPLRLMVPATIAASFAFMMPVGTPPNAIVFATGQVRVPQMVRAGWRLHLMGVTVVTLVGWFFSERVVPRDVVPESSSVGLVEPTPGPASEVLESGALALNAPSPA
ncbi:MAG: SLC13 family permease [Phycisphaerales bacterium]|jgi:sodium-dependent dicarboxylate transporter 2/3/5|nr:SLC13 family permease [Phycisphaerales bacterium]